MQKFGEVDRWHKFGMRVGGVLAQFWGTVGDSEFEKLTRYNLPPGWVAWHEGSCDQELLRKRPFVIKVNGWGERFYVDPKPLLTKHIAEQEELAKAAAESVGTF